MGLENDAKEQSSPNQEDGKPWKITNKKRVLCGKLFAK
jgi:hypothetical protein